METFDEENPRQRGLRKLLWDIRLIAVIVIGGICYASFEIWNRVFDARLRDMTAREQSAMNRDVANFLSDSTAAGGRTETVRWVNLTIEDIIITSKHPQQLRVEESLVSTDEASISPDDIQNQTSETTAGEGLIPPHPRTQRHRLPHDSDVDADDDEADVRHWSFRASLQGTKRVSLLAHYQLNNRWALESGLSYGHLKDDWEDEKKLSGLAGDLVFRRRAAFVENIYPRQAEVISASLKKLSVIEKEYMGRWDAMHVSEEWKVKLGGEVETCQRADTDEVSRPFGELMGELFVMREDAFAPILRRFGFLLGKYIYLIDALDDIEKDRKNNSFNPFLYSGHPDVVRESMEVELDETGKPVKEIRIRLADLSLMYNNI